MGAGGVHGTSDLLAKPVIISVDAAWPAKAGLRGAAPALQSQLMAAAGRRLPLVGIACEDGSCWYTDARRHAAIYLERASSSWASRPV